MKGIHLERFYPHPPERVFEALATSRGIAAWLMPNDFEPVVGRRFTLRWKKQPGWRGFVECELLELVPGRRLVYSWKGSDRQQPSTVRWTLEPAPGGTRLRLDHDGFRGLGGFLLARMMRSGWKSRFLGRLLPEVLDVLQSRGAAALTPRQP